MMARKTAFCLLVATVSAMLLIPGDGSAQDYDGYYQDGGNNNDGQWDSIDNDRDNDGQWDSIDNDDGWDDGWR